MSGALTSSIFNSISQIFLYEDICLTLSYFRVPVPMPSTKTTRPRILCSSVSRHTGGKRFVKLTNKLWLFAIRVFQADFRCVDHRLSEEYATMFFQTSVTSLDMIYCQTILKSNIMRISSLFYIKANYNMLLSITNLLCTIMSHQKVTFGAIMNDRHWTDSSTLM